MGTKGEMFVKLTVSSSAVQWIQSALNVHSGDSVRLFVKYGGSYGPTPGFSLGMAKAKPHDIGIQTTVDGITFFMEDQDLWFLDHHDVLVDTSVVDGEIEFLFQKTE
jgi:uncharacterized protein YneR